MIIGSTNVLWGRRLRWVLLILLADAPGPLTVAELLHRLDRAGCEVHGRPSKAVSDALRWETRRGRVVRLTRSTYAIRYLARSSEWWIRQQVRDLLLNSNAVQPPSDNGEVVPDWLAAVARRLDRSTDSTVPDEAESPLR